VVYAGNAIIFRFMHLFRETGWSSPLHVIEPHVVALIASEQVADHELAEARKRDAIDRAHITKGAAAAAALAAAAEGEQTAGLHSDVEADIHNMLSGGWVGGISRVVQGVLLLCTAYQLVACMPNLHTARLSALWIPICADLHVSSSLFERKGESMVTVFLTLLAGQSYGELNTLETNVQASLASGEGDPEYWTAVLQRLQIYKVSNAAAC
jgi:hypothetical protein